MIGAVASVAVGGALVLFVVVDAAMTVLHPDGDGHLTRVIQRVTWALARLGGRGTRAAAGPVMMTLTLLMWWQLLVLGHALVVLPFLDGSFRSEPELGTLGLPEALYYAGGNVVVLGYGDITPISWPLQLLAVGVSATGFALLTAFVTYVVQLTSSLNARVRFTLRVADHTGGHDGVDYVAALANPSDARPLRDELAAWSDLVRDVTDRLHRLPAVSLFHRSRDPSLDPEPTFKIALDVERAVHLLISDPRYVELEPTAVAYRRACARLTRTIGRRYFSSTEQAQIDQPAITEEDRSEANDTLRRLGNRTPIEQPSPATLDEAAEAAARTRVFAAALERLAD
jgi:hypothetical protein